MAKTNLIFPELIGLAFSVYRIPVFSTDLSTTKSGLETTTGNWAFPRYDFRLPFEFLRADSNQELQAVEDFFLMVGGRRDNWLFYDRTCNAVTSQSIGASNGVIKQFQCARQVKAGGFVMPVYDLKAGSLKVYVNGAQVSTGWTVNGSGLITFTAAPEAGAIITADFGFYFRVRFSDDTAEFENFMFQLWRMQELKLTGVKQ
jgi:uncharacterized protein (TIGR02217 family)